jgi:hypothetical protein
MADPRKPVCEDDSAKNDERIFLKTRENDRQKKTRRPKEMQKFIKRMRMLLDVKGIKILKSLESFLRH